MDRQRWRVLRERDPPLASRILSLGTQLYEQGAEKARGSPELKELLEVFRSASPDVRQDLGIDGDTLNETQILTAIFDQGSSLLLDYVRTGTCD
jgi:hypothetical protein